MGPGVKVQIGTSTLYHGDCLGVMAALGGKSVTHVFTDPPYEDEFHSAVKRIKKDGRQFRKDGQKMTKALGFDGVNAQRAEFAKAMVGVSRGWLLAFSLAEGIRAWRDDIQAAGGKWDTVCFWAKPDAMPRMNGQGPARAAECMALAWCGKGYRGWNGGGKRGLYTHPCNPPQRDGRHPTEKPVALMMELIADFTQPGDVILDPFMGSGTTLIAAARTGRIGIGIERDRKWFDVACDRLGGDMFLAAGIPEPSKPVDKIQADMFTLDAAASNA